jgi:hypothetical protein
MRSIGQRQLLTQELLTDTGLTSKYAATAPVQPAHAVEEIGARAVAAVYVGHCAQLFTVTGCCC